MAERDLHIPDYIKIERIDRYDSTGDIKILYLRSADCLISVSRIEGLLSGNWEKIIEKIYEIYKFKEYPKKNFFYAINANSDTLIAYQLTEFVEGKKYLSQNFFFIFDQIYFEFYGPEFSPEKAMDYIREIFYHDKGENSNWDYIRFTNIEDLKL